jgi:N-acetylglucosaminyl-diphospho-decaprenol L-rhamnosyltransferase
MSPTIGVVIVSYNTCELLRACLESLRACTLPLRVVVVENASRDGSTAMVHASFPEVELIELEHNLGFAAGNNIGLEHLHITQRGRVGERERGRVQLCR